MGKHIIIKNARCSFPQLYGTKVEEGDTFGPGITLVLESHTHGALLKEIKAAMREAISGNPKLKKSPPTGERLCLREPIGDELKYKEGNLMLKANSPRPPIVLHPDGCTIMNESANLIYSGCYVNAKVEIWGQANKYGKRVNAKLIAVQYVPREAESFDGSYVSAEEAMSGFESLDGDPSLGGNSAVDLGLDEDDLLA